MTHARRLSPALATALALAVTACAADDPAPPAATAGTQLPGDVAAAVDQLPDATVLRTTADGVPRELAGTLGQVAPLRALDHAAIEAALRPQLPAIAAAFRLEPAALALRKVRRDDRGAHHLRFAQRHRGLDVVGGDLVVHVDADGVIYAVNGTARGDLSPKLGASPIGEPAALARVGQEAANAALARRVVRTVYLLAADGRAHQAYEIEVTGTRGELPVRDLVYVDVDTGAIAAVYPEVHSALSRWVKEYRYEDAEIYDNYVEPKLRVEGQAPLGDADVDGAYDLLGHTYNAYQQVFGRDSFDGGGRTLNTWVDYPMTCNAFYADYQIAFGTPGYGCNPPTQSLDVAAHEFTHGVTRTESGLVYAGEPGGINESLSDVFGAFVETWLHHGGTGALDATADTWLFGDEFEPPFSRNLCDPAADGHSLDAWTPDARLVDVHYSSGIGNLMFCLLAKGGTHPRGTTQVPVTGVGFGTAIRLAYKAQVDILTSHADYLDYRAAMVQAATELGYDDTVREAIGCAFAAVNVGTAPPPCAVGTPAPVPSLRNGVGAAGIAMAAGEYRYWKIDVPAGLSSFTVKTTGGTGRSTLYVQRGAKPTTTTYACRAANAASNTNTCLFTSPAAGTYYIMDIAATAVADMHLTASYVAASGAPYFFGSGLIAMAGAAGSTRLWRVYGGGSARANVQVTMGNGTGDADLYVRVGSPPTAADYDCRPYTPGNNESCTTTSSGLADHYIMVKGYKAYDGVSLVVSY